MAAIVSTFRSLQTDTNHSICFVSKPPPCAQVLGKGNFGIVHMVHHKKTNQPYACKSISKRKLTSADDVEDVRREIQILLHLAGHKHVVQMYGAYEDKSYIHL